MAGVSLAAAVLLWNLAYFFFVLILLGLTTAALGDVGMPRWIPASALALAIALLAWGLLDAWARRFEPVTDRHIIGWHLFGDFVLLPVRVTLAVWGNLSAMRWLNREEIERAWALLHEIRDRGKAQVSALSLVEPDANRLFRLLTALQLTQLIDLHKGEQDWFYTVRGDQAESLQRMLAGDPPI